VTKLSPWVGWSGVFGTQCRLCVSRTACVWRCCEERARLRYHIAHRLWYQYKISSLLRLTPTEPGTHTHTHV